MVQALGAALCAGAILFFFSETLFWGRPGRAPLAELVLSALAYSVLAGALLAVLAGTRARSAAALVLCGAVYGWLSEGVLAGTLYQNFPVQVSWTGLAWHDLLSVCGGLFGLGAALRHSLGRTVTVSALLGVFWGAWATTWWQPGEGAVVTPLAAFALHAAGQGALLALAYWALPGLLRGATFTSRNGRTGLALVLLAWFGVVTVPAQLTALLILPPLLVLTGLALRRHARQPAAGQELLLDVLRRPIRATRSLAVLTMPAVAAGVYGLLLLSGRSAGINVAVYWVLTPLGFAAYALSWWRVWRGAGHSRGPSAS